MLHNSITLVSMNNVQAVYITRIWVLAIRLWIKWCQQMHLIRASGILENGDVCPFSIFCLIFMEMAKCFYAIWNQKNVRPRHYPLLAAAWHAQKAWMPNISCMVSCALYQAFIAFSWWHKLWHSLVSLVVSVFHWFYLQSTCIMIDILNQCTTWIVTLRLSRKCFENESPWKLFSPFKNRAIN